MRTQSAMLWNGQFGAESTKQLHAARTSPAESGAKS